MLNNGTKKLGWDQFYGLLLSQAQTEDSINATKNGDSRRRTSFLAQNPSGRRQNNQSGRGQDKSYTKYTGPDMKMEAGMFFGPADWRNLTSDQKAQLTQLAAERRKNFNNNNSPTSASTSSATQVNQSTQTVSFADCGSEEDKVTLRSLLSEVAAWKQNVNVAQVKYDLSVHELPQIGSLIDSGANGGLDGADVRVMSESHYHADITWIADNTIT